MPLDSCHRCLIGRADPLSSLCLVQVQPLPALSALVLLTKNSAPLHPTCQLTQLSSQDLLVGFFQQENHTKSFPCHEAKPGVAHREEAAWRMWHKSSE